MKAIAEGVTELSPSASVVYVNKFLSQSQADILFAKYKSSAHFEYRNIRMFGKDIREPRKTTLFGSLPYRYAGSLRTPCTALPADMRDVALAAEKAAGVERHWFNVALGNHYGSGEEYMGPHRDDEKELDSSVIASVSLGEARRFVIERWRGGSPEAWSLELQHGSLLLMLGDTFQKEWKHSLPKQAGKAGTRVNWTFRHIYSPP